MSVKRSFYITQGSLTVFEGKHADDGLVFADSDAGLAEFEAYLAECPEQPSQIVLDVIEEVFAKDAIPKLGVRDRKALIPRRARRKFPRTPYRVSMFGGSIDAQPGEHTVVHSAISNHELLNPWLSAITSNRVPLKGIYSVPLMGGDLLPRLFKVKGPVLLLTHHQGDKLRQVYLRDGRVMSARLSQSAPSSDPGYAAHAANELVRARRYLERTRLIGGMEELRVCMVAPKAIGESIARAAASESPARYQVVEPGAAAKKLGAETPGSPDRLESLFIAHAAQHGSRHSYASAKDTAYWTMHRIRHGIIGISMSASVACSILAGVYFGDAWLVTRQAADIQQQVSQVSEALRRDNEQYTPIQADSHEMKVAVDTGDFLLDNRVPVPWVLQQLGGVLGDYPDVQVLDLEWTAGSAAMDDTAPRARRGEPVPVSLPEVSHVDAWLGGIVVKHDGDLRKIFARIDRLAAALADDSDFSSVEVVRYPLDASPSASISGEISKQNRSTESQFRLHLVYQLPGRVTETAEDSHDPV